LFQPTNTAAAPLIITMNSIA